jgi:YVTN family beta-propeller protein
LVATIPNGGFGIAVDSGTGLVFVAASTTPSVGAVSVIDTVTGKVIDTVKPLRGGNPWAIAVDVTAGEAYVTYPNDRMVAVLDTSTRELLAEIRVGSLPDPDLNRPFSVAVDPEGRALYVGMEDGTVAVIDTTARRVVDTVTVGDNVSRSETPDMAVDPSSGDLYVANAQTDTLSVIDRDSRQVVKTITGLGRPQGLAVDPSTGQAFVSGARRVSVIDTRTREVIDSIIAGGVGGVAVDPTAGVVYVSGMTVIDARTHKIIDTVSGFAFHGLAVDPATGNVYLTQGFGRDVSVLGAP